MGSCTNNCTSNWAFYVFSALECLEISSVNDTWVKIRDSIKASAKEKAIALLVYFCQVAEDF